MSVGGVFTLISNTGIQDKLIMATDKLLDNVRQIGASKLLELKQKNPTLSNAELLKMESDWFPTMSELEKTHILFVRSTFKPFIAIAHEYSKTVPRGGIPAMGGTFSFTLPIIGEFINDAVMYIKLKNFNAISSLDKVRYVEYLAHKLVKNVKFKVQNHLVDEYDTNNQNVYYQFKVPIGKEVGYLRNIGQEVPVIGTLTADPTVDEVREYRFYGTGPQTFKQAQPDLEMWVPMLFWFKDIQNSLPNFLLPMNQTEIEITLESDTNLVAYTNYGGGGAYRAPIVSECYLYLNHIFLLPEISRIFVSRFGYQLIRVHRNHTERLVSSEGSVLLHQLKWPIECLYVGFRPTVNLTNTQRWYKNTHITSNNVATAVVTSGTTIEVNQAVYLDEKHVVQKLGLSAHDIIIYPEMPPEFYNNYIPFRYGPNLKTAEQLGWYMMNFNMYPGDQQPSGHLNSSRSRELYLKYKSAIVSNDYIIRPANPVDLIVIADAINFLLFTNGNLTLQFST